MFLALNNRVERWDNRKAWKGWRHRHGIRDWMAWWSKKIRLNRQVEDSEGIDIAWREGGILDRVLGSRARPPPITRH